MASNRELDICYMKVALAHAELSKAVRKKVGACLVTKNGVIVPGYNGTPSGTDNCCEDQLADGSLVTKSEVIHSELNCILKCAKQGIGTEGCKLYLTLSPCLDKCAPMLLQAGVSEVIYLEAYRCLAGVEYLKKYGVEVRQLNL